VKLEAARTFALSLPETTEEPHFDMSSFRVKGKIFCTVPSEGKTLHVFADANEAAALVAAQPTAYEHIAWGGRERPEWLRVHLAKAKAPDVKGLLEDAWLAKAPPMVLKRAGRR
jgi:hypothetical protein